jgi:hypothetical protein
MGSDRRMAGQIATAPLSPAPVRACLPRFVVLYHVSSAGTLSTIVFANAANLTGSLINVSKD